ncbi:carotenoid oxygenase family protein [Novosphingobium sp.]|uniref:carotenoid oxygenase family protein n=1 Tax=Novosphingobium sp. TaxID=1874826 RepID=UPI00261E3D90|nr:carotenoid oxygenase family protein [Novosphingobium sp.]
MTQRFPAEVNFTGPLEPTRIEADVCNLEVEGSIPASICGTFFRVQPDPAQVPFIKDDIFFNGDGLVSAFVFKDGRVDYRSRYAHTPKLLAERAAGQALFGRYRNPFTDDPSVAGMNRTTSNTHVFVHAGKLLALKEDAMPTAMDPVTLETIGEERFGGAITGETFTAHPKVDPVSGELIGFGYEAKGLGSRDLVYYAVDAQGQLVREVFIEAPYASMVHDWGVTQSYVIFALSPLRCNSIDAMRAGGAHFVYDNALEQLYGVLPRDGEAKDIRWFRLPHGFQAHSFNAFEDGRKVYLDMTVASGNVFDFFPDENGHVPHPMTLTVPVTRMCFDLGSGEASRRELTTPDRIMGDFPHCDDRYATLPYRYGFMTSIDPSREYDYDRLGPPAGMFFNGVGRLDMHTGEAKRWWAGPSSGMQEPVFVPRSADAPEGDGYIMAVVDRLAERRSDLVVLDTDDIEGEPLALVRLPFRLRTGLHGNWVPAGQITP